MPSDSIKNLKKYYENSDSLQTSIGNDFLLPCLKECKKYRRSTGYFTSSSLHTYIKAIDNFIKNEVEIEILCSPIIDFRLFNEFKNTTDLSADNLKKLKKYSESQLIDACGLSSTNNQKNEYINLLLRYLITSQKLKIKFAFMNKFLMGVFNDGEAENFYNRYFDSRIYHTKRGYFVFNDDSIVAFRGSFNESFNAHYLNYEDVTVHKSWEKNHQEYLDLIIQQTDRDWRKNDGNPDIIVEDISEEVLKKIKTHSPSSRPKEGNEPNNIGKQTPDLNLDPKLPSNINGVDFELKSHQITALADWKKIITKVFLH